MVAYESFDPDAEVKGAEVLSVAEAAGRLSTVFGERAEELLAEHGLDDVEPEEWYPLQAYLDTIEHIADQVGDEMVLYVGKELPDIIDWPSDVSTVVDAMESITAAYEMFHRGDRIGYYDLERLGGNEVRLTCRNPYPCSLTRGVIRGAGERFSPPTAFVDLEEESSRCRADGGEECVYRVTW